MRDVCQRIGPSASARACWWLIALTLATGVGLAGCGGGDDEKPTAQQPATDEAAGVAEAQAALDAKMAEAQWQAPGPPVDAAKARGKTVWYLSMAQAIPIITTISIAIKEGLQEAGVKVVICDGNFDPTQYTRCAAQAIAQNADVIMNESMPPELLSDAMARAEKAGIPWIDGNNGNPDDPLPTGADARVAFNYTEGGSLAADWIIADSNGKANVVLIFSADILPSAIVRDGALDEFTKLCPACKVEVRDIVSAQWATGLGPLTRSLLTADPSITHILPMFDGMTTFIVPAVHEAGAADRVKVATFNGSLDPMKTMAKGDVIGADVGSDAVWMGWGYADQALRLLTGLPGAPTENIPNRVFTQESVSDLSLTLDAYRSGEWYGRSLFKEEYLKLWGLK